jgi:tripartite ATP-independent transporter DctM subunit
MLHLAEQSAVSFLLLGMAAVPVVELVRRNVWGVGLAAEMEYLQHGTLFLAFVGGLLAARSGRHLKMIAIEAVLPARVRQAIDFGVSMIAALVCFCLAWASLQLVIAEAPPLPASWQETLPGWIETWFPMLYAHGSLTQVGGWLPVWIAELIMPVGFLGMALRFAGQAGESPGLRRLALVSLPLSIALPMLGAGIAPQLVVPGIIGLVAATALGLPIFALLGGVALLLFWGDGVTTAAIPAETYRIVTSPVFPAIPLFTLAGFVLSESRASERLVGVFHAWFGWLPGGTAVAVTVLCAFFTTFTGASGVTILALGGVLLPVLREAGFRERFSLGLLTSTGSVGLLLPPSLVVILYAVVARIPINEMFLAAILPGMILVVAICFACMWEGRGMKADRTSFRPRQALSALWKAKWEVAIPVIALIAIFGGYCTLIQAAAIVVVYALVVEMVIYRDIQLTRLIPMLTECGILIGGVLMILGVAIGLTSYLVDAQIPDAAADWAGAHIQSRWVFLLLLNGALILVGCVMDIYSALIVVVPILLPMAHVFEVHPVHLGVIFLANLEVGYLTPPIGMNLFLSSFRFKKPLPEVYRAAVRFLLIMVIVVLLITFVPWLTLEFPQYLPWTPATSSTG